MEFLFKIPIAAAVAAAVMATMAMTASIVYILDRLSEA